MTPDRIEELRAKGILVEKSKGHYIVKIGLCAGALTSARLRQIADLADKFATGEIHATTRQGIDILHVPQENVEAIVAEMDKMKIPHAASGKRLRAVVACPGSKTCRFGNDDTQEMAAAIKKEFGSFEGLNCKVKVAVTGCLNACAKPQENCIGLIAAGRGQWKIYLGGKLGRKPRLSTEYKTVESKEEAFTTIQNVLEWMRDNGTNKERLSDMLLRLEENCPKF